MENGWGMSVVQHRDLLFSVIYAYDAAGKPIWYVMPGGTWNEAKTAFRGALYVPTGTPYSALNRAVSSSSSISSAVALARSEPIRSRISSDSPYRG